MKDVQIEENMYTTYKDSMKKYESIIQDIKQILKNNSAQTNISILDEVKYSILENSFLSQ